MADGCLAVCTTFVVCSAVAAQSRWCSLSPCVLPWITMIRPREKSTVSGNRKVCVEVECLLLYPRQESAQLDVKSSTSQRRCHEPTVDHYVVQYTRQDHSLPACAIDNQLAERKEVNGRAVRSIAFQRQ